MEEKFGLIKGTKCMLRKADPEIVKNLTVKTGIKEEKLKDMMSYNMFTINQFAQLSGLTVSVVHNKTRPILVGEAYTTELDFCLPFSDNENEGPKFIIRNGKSDECIKKYLKA